MRGLLSVPRWLWHKAQAFKEFVSAGDMKAVYGEHPNGDPEGPGPGGFLGGGGT